MRGINKVILVGSLGADPETKYLQGGSAFTRFRMATTDAWKDKHSGEKKEKTEWHSVVMFGRVAEVAAEYCRKGSKVYIEGALETRKWQDKDGKDKYTTEVKGRELMLLGSPRGRPDAGEGGPPADDIPY